MRIRVGDLARTIGSLRPAGEVEVRGRVYPARSLVGWVDAGAVVAVVGWDAFGLVVGPPNAALGAEVPSADELVARREAVAVSVRQEEVAARRAENVEFLVGLVFIAACTGLGGVAGWAVGGADFAACGVGVGISVGLAVVIGVVVFANSLR